MRKICAMLLTVLLFVTVSSNAETLSEKIGVAHTAGNYCLTKKPFLLEGAEQIRKLGSKVIKVFLQHPNKAYPHNSVWSEDKEIPNIVDVLKTDYFRELFKMDFKTFILQAHIDTADDCYWRDGLTDEEWWKIEQNYYDAAIHLFRTYAGRGLTFILEHWEADLYYQKVREQFKDFDPKVAQQGFIDYFNARAEGVKRARLEAASEGISGVTVQTAVEIIYVSTKASEVPDKFRIIDHMDEIRADAVAYSMGLECMQNMPQMVKNIQTLVKKSGGRPWYFGEFQATETRFNPAEGTATKYDTAKKRSIRHKKNSLGQIDAALRMGAKYVILWEIYHNESNDLATNMDGYGLIREDGTQTALAKYLPSLLTLDSIPSSEYIGRDYIESLAPGSVLNWFYDSSSKLFANGAQTTLAKNVKVSLGEGLVMHTVRSGGNRPGDSKASKGEPVSFWTDGYAGMTSFLMKTPSVPAPLTTYSDSAFRARALPPEIPGKFANGKLNARYSKSVTVSGDSAPYKWAMTSGDVPDGLTLKFSGAKAKLSGTPEKSGTFKFVLRVTDKNKATVSKKFTVKITKPAISGTFSDGVLKTKYSETLNMSGGVSPYKLTQVSGKLPTGLKLTSSDVKVKLSGTPKKAGTFKFKLRVTDANAATSTKSFTVKITKVSSSSLNEASSPAAELKIVSADIVEKFGGKDSDLVKVKTGTPLRFTVTNRGTSFDNVAVYVDDKELDTAEVYDEGEFTIPAEAVSGDFKVGVKAQDFESEELYIIAE